MEPIGAEAARLAGLQIDELHKIRSGQIALRHLEWFLGLSREQREQYYNDARAKYVVRIDRTQPFDPIKFLGFGEGFSVEEQDERALKLTELSPSKVLLAYMLNEADTQITGEKTLEQLKETGRIRLDAQILANLFKNQEVIPESWEGKGVYFDGTIIRGPEGHRYALCLYQPGGKTDRWTWNLVWLETLRHPHQFSAVLEST